MQRVSVVWRLFGSELRRHDRYRRRKRYRWLLLRRYEGLLGVAKRLKKGRWGPASFHAAAKPGE